MARKNYYHLLELDYNITDFEEINRAILRKQAEWSRQTKIPGRDNEARANLAMLEDIKQIMSDPDLRKEEAEAARKIEHETRLAKERALYAELDTMVAVIAQKGWVEEIEVQRMAEFLDLPETDVRSRISFPIEARPITEETASFTQVNTHLAEVVAKGCEKLNIKTSHISGVPSIYDFLQKAPTASTKELLRVAEEMYEKIHRERRSAKNDLIRELQSRAQTIFKNDRLTYDQALSQLRLQKLDQTIKIAGATKQMRPEVLEALKKQVMNYGDLTEGEAQSYLEQFCQANDIQLVTKETAEVSLTLNKCGICGLVNDDQSEFCTNCGTKLVIECPTCQSQARSTDHSCAKCGFDFSDLAKVPDLLRKAKQEKFLGRFEEAERYLKEVLQVWPRHAEANQLFQQIDEQKRLENEKVSKMKQLMKEKKYYTARNLFIQERKLVETSLSLKNMERESLQRIHQAENFLLQAKQAKSDTAKLSYYLRAAEIAVDCQEANRALTKWPPKAPTDLQVSLEDEEIKLSWTKSDDEGEIFYRVLRKRNEPSHHFHDGEILSESTKNSLIDKTAVGGYSYYYTVYALRGAIVSREGLTSGPFMNLENVTEVYLNQDQDQIKISWNPPKGARAIEVWKKEGATPARRGDGQLLQQVTMSGVVDADVTYGKTYGYLIIALYESNGQQFYSTGQGIKHHMIERPKMLQQVSALRKEKGILLEWEPLESSENKVDFYYAYQPITVEANKPISVEELSSLGHKIQIDEGANRVLLMVEMDRPVYIVPITYNDELAIPGQVILSKNRLEVTNVHHQVNGNDLFLKWQWPEGIHEVIVAYHDKTYPLDPQDHQAKVTVVNQATYNALNGFKLSLEEQDYYFTIFTRYEEEGQLVHSNGVQYLHVNSEQVTVFYELKVSRNIFRRRIVLEITTDQPITLPTLVLSKKAQRIPTTRSQGEDILHIASQKIDGTLRFDIPLEHMQENMYAKLFFEKDQDAKKFRLLANSGKQSMHLW